MGSWVKILGLIIYLGVVHVPFTIWTGDMYYPRKKNKKIPKQKKEKKKGEICQGKKRNQPQEEKMKSARQEKGH